MSKQVLKVGNKIELNKKAGNQSVLADEPTTYVSQILDLEEEELIAAMPIHEGHIIPLEVGTVLEAYIYTVKGIFRADCRVTARGKEDNIYFMSLQLLSELRKFQRRQFYRLPCSIEVQFRPLSAVEVLQYAKARELPPQAQPADQKGMIVDISGGGVRMITDKSYYKNDFVLLRFPIEMNIGVKWIETMGRVVASYPSPNRSDFYDNRVQFKEITHELRDAIVKYIFEQQRKIQQRERG